MDTDEAGLVFDSPAPVSLMSVSAIFYFVAADVGRL